MVSGFPLLTTDNPAVSTIRRGGCHSFFRDERLLVFRDHKLMLDYRFHAEQPSCFGRLAGPVSGLPLTSTDELPWNHGPSMFFSCDHVNGKTFRHAPQSHGKITTLDIALKSCTQDAVEFTHSCQWMDGKNRPIMKDDRCFLIRFPMEGLYTIDCSFTMTPLVDVVMNPAGHSFLGLKTANDIAPDGGGKLRNSSGQEGMKNTFGQNAKWCTCFGSRRGMQNRQVEGIAILIPNTMQEPFGKQSRWLTRDYGLLVPNSLHFLNKPCPRQQGEALTLQYRVVAYSGQPNDDLLNSYTQHG